MTSKKIAIIGAGISGLACAGQLSQADYAVTVFDKSQGVGGRMSHRDFEKWGADHGAQYFTTKDPLFTAEVQKWIKEGVASPWLGKIATYTHGQSKALADTKQRFVGVPAMTAPAKFLAKGLNIELNHTITSINRAHDHWELCIHDEQSLTDQFEQVIFAIPPVQAKHLIARYSKQLSAVCDQANMLPCWTLMAYLKKPLDLPFDGAFVNDSLFSWIARDNTKPERPRYETWVAQASHAWSQEHVDLSHYEVEPALVEAFNALTGASCDLYQSHLWRYAKLETESTINFSLDSQMQLGLCGDWLRASTIEGAWLSGYLLAQEFISLND